MPRVARRGREAEVPIERDGPVVLGVNRERTHADHVRDLKRAPERIKQQAGTDASALCVGVDGEAREHHQSQPEHGEALRESGLIDAMTDSRSRVFDDAELTLR